MRTGIVLLIAIVLSATTVAAASARTTFSVAHALLHHLAMAFAHFLGLLLQSFANRAAARFEAIAEIALRREAFAGPVLASKNLVPQNGGDFLAA